MWPTNVPVKRNGIENFCDADLTPNEIKYKKIDIFRLQNMQQYQQEKLGRFMYNMEMWCGKQNLEVKIRDGCRSGVAMDDVVRNYVVRVEIVAGH